MLASVSHPLRCARLAKCDISTTGLFRPADRSAGPPLAHAEEGQASGLEQSVRDRSGASSALPSQSSAAAAAAARAPIARP
jgi:hypothetical protein